MSPETCSTARVGSLEMADADSHVHFSGVLVEELERLGALFEEDEVAFLALTSTIEGPVRDRLAYRLHKRLGSSWLVAREWRKDDIAVLSRGDRAVPIMLLEAKALYTFDLVGAAAWVQRYPDMVARDFEKWSAYGRGRSSLVPCSPPTRAELLTRT